MSDMYYVAIQRDLLDYFATGITLLLSVIAVIIAVSTAKRQNKIALFDKRFVVLESLGNVLNFSDEIATNKLELESLGSDPELKAWAVAQVNDGGLQDEISFIPYPGKEPQEISKEAVRRDVHLLRKHLVSEALVLTRGCPLFPEPIRSELECLKESYLQYILSLLSEYGDINYETKPTEELKNSFLFYSNKFKNNSKLMRNTLRQLKL